MCKKFKVDGGTKSTFFSVAELEKTADEYMALMYNATSSSSHLFDFISARETRAKNVMRHAKELLDWDANNAYEQEEEENAVINSRQEM